MTEMLASFEGHPDQCVTWCNCGKCKRAFYVPKKADEKWMPNFCPFCGMKFELMDIDGDPAVYSPVEE